MLKRQQFENSESNVTELKMLKWQRMDAYKNEKK